MKIFIKRKWLLAIFISVALTFFCVKFLFLKDDKPDYITAVVTRGNIAKTIETNGKIEAKEQVEVSSRITGTLKKLYVQLGQKVKKGQLLALMESDIQEIDLSKSQANLADVLAQKRGQQIQLIKAQKELLRQQEMIKSGATSQADLQIAESELLVTQSNIEALNAKVNYQQSAIKEAKLNLSHTFIRSPMDGTVIDLTKKEGEHVVAATNAPIILRLAQLDTMTVKAKISEVDIMGIMPRQVAQFSIYGMSNKRFGGILSDIGLFPSNDSEGVTYYNVSLDVPNPNKILRVGMAAQVSILLKEAKNVLLIPSSSLEGFGGDGWYVVKVLDAQGKVQQRRVRIGINNYSVAQVLSGLKLNEKIIIGLNDENEKTKKDEKDDKSSGSARKKSKTAIRF
jgi:macrolide-specific efflux system membrane fusion protein